MLHALSLSVYTCTLQMHITLYTALWRCTKHEYGGRKRFCFWCVARYNALFGRNAYSSVVVSLMKACVRWVFVISVADRQTGLDTSLPCQWYSARYTTQWNACSVVKWSSERQCLSVVVEMNGRECWGPCWPWLGPLALWEEGRGRKWWGLIEVEEEKGEGEKRCSDRKTRETVSTGKRESNAREKGEVEKRNLVYLNSLRYETRGWVTLFLFLYRLTLKSQFLLRKWAIGWAHR